MHIVCLADAFGHVKRDCHKKETFPEVQELTPSPHLLGFPDD